MMDKETKELVAAVRFLLTTVAVREKDRRKHLVAMDNRLQHDEDEETFPNDEE